jgi:hypothetical protein
MPALSLGGGASPELCWSRRSGATVGLLTCGLAVEYERGMGNPLVGSGRGGIGRRGRPAVTGGSARRRNDGARVPASGAIYGLQQPAQKEQGLEEVLTKGLWRSGCSGMGKSTTEETGRRSWAGGSGEARGPLAARIGREGSCGGNHGVRAARDRPASRELGRRHSSPAAVLHGIPMMQRPGVKLRGSESF